MGGAAMRPVTLRMSAFGPYAGAAIIPVSELGKNGLYLITGDTGSGKTTIFDAISYALYGQPSGHIRDVKMFRSKYADIGTPTEVELTFEYAGKTFTVKRNPGGYERAAKRGGGTTKEVAEAELKMPDGRVITKRNEVNEVIHDIMGIDKDQFSQIAMIAQGDFLELLHASTEDRKKIFRQVFKTDNYEALQDRLKELASDLRSQAKNLEQTISIYVGSIAGDPQSELYPEVEKAKEGTL
ncbi:MAG: SMC family ATPase, partial [Eggerthellaceae bacterium]|nr:SMC family ATPase [Eggerthellaceae bacterium]